MATRREFVAGSVALGVAEALREARGGILRLGGAAGPAPQTFDYYISAIGDDNNPGTLASPWSITALNSKQATYAGKRVGIIGNTASSPTVIQYGTVGGVQTTLYSLYQALWTFSGYTNGAAVLSVQGGASGTPTYIACCNSSGQYSPRTAIIDGSDPSTGDLPETSGVLLGQTGAGSNPVTSWGNVTYDGLVLRNFTYGAILHSGTATNIQSGVTVQNCEIYNGQNVVSDQNPGAIQVVYPSGLVVTNCKIYSVVSNGTGSVQGTISGTTLTVDSVNSGFVPLAAVIYGSGIVGAPYITSQLTAVGGVPNGAGTYSISSSQTISTAETLTLGPSSTMQAVGFIQFNQDRAGGAATEISNCTFYGCCAVSNKDGFQSMNVSYCYLGYGTFGDPTGSNLGGTVHNYLTGSGKTVNFHHNICVGPVLGYGESADQPNEGTVNFYHNTFYHPPGLLYGPLGAFDGYNTTMAPTGVWNWTDNLVWSDGGETSYYYDAGDNFGAACSFPNATSGTVGTSNYNAYGANNNGMTFCVANGFGPAITLASWQADGFDANAVSLTTTPFSGTPSEADYLSFSVSSSSPAYTAAQGGGIAGAVDGSGAIGSNF